MCMFSTCSEMVLKFHAQFISILKIYSHRAPLRLTHSKKNKAKNVT